MKLALLCRNSKLYSHRHLVKAAKTRGPVVRDVNSSPGLEGFDITGKIIAFIEKSAKPRQITTCGMG